MSYRRELFKGGVAGGLISGIGQGGNILLRFLLSRFLGPFGIGLFEIGLSIIRISSSIAQGGISQIIVKYLAQAESKEIQWLYFKTGLRVAIIMSFLVIFCLLIGRKIIYSQVLENDSQVVFYSILLSIPLWSISQYFAFSLRGYGKIAKSVAVQTSIFPYIMLSSLLILYWYGYYSINILFPSILICITFTSLCGLIFLKEKKSSVYSKGFLRKEIIKDSIPVWTISIARILSLRLDKIILAFFVATDLVGIYSIAFLLASILQFIPDFVTPVSQPMIAKEIKNPKRVETLYQDLILISTIMMVPTFIFLVVSGEYLLNLFGDGFSNGYQAMIILSFGILFNGVIGPTGNIMIMGNHQKLLALIQYAALGLFILSSWILIPIYGILGAAIGRTFSWVCSELIKLYYVNKIQGLTPLNMYYIRKILAYFLVHMLLCYIYFQLDDQIMRILIFIIMTAIICNILFRRELKALISSLKK